MSLVFIMGFIIGVFVVSLLEGLVFIYILRNPSILHKLVRILPGDLADRWEGEFDVGFYGYPTDDDCCQGGSCACDEQCPENESNYDRTME